MTSVQLWRGSIVKAPKATSPNQPAAQVARSVRLFCVRFDRALLAATCATRFFTPMVGLLQHPRGMTRRQTQAIDLTDPLGQGSAS